MKKLILFALILTMILAVGCGDADLKSTGNDDFCYSQLSKKEKKVYDALNDGIKNRQDRIEKDVGGLDIDDFDRVFKGVVADHPEYFWLSGSYTCQSGVIIGEGKVNSVEPEYTVSEAQFESKKSEFDSAVSSIVAKCSGYSDAYQKAVILHDAIVGGTQYVDDSDKMNSTAFGAIVNKKAICSGYAKAYKYLLNQVGIKCEYVEGTLSDGVGHAWNIVILGNESFWVDTTLDDPVFLGANNTGVNIFYNYFGLTDNQIESTHNLSENYDCPKCDNEQYDYYKKMGLYVSGGNTSQAEAIIKSAYGSGKAVATVKFSDIGSLDSARSSIFNGSRIFELIGSKSVSYSVDSNNCLLIVKFR